MCSGRNQWIGLAAGIAAGFATLGGLFATIDRADAQSQAAAPVDTTAKADEVLSKAVAAVYGDIAKERSIRSVRMSGAFEMPSMGINGTMTSVLDIEGGRMLTVTEIPGMTTESQGIDGEVAWANSTMQGPRLLEAEERTLMERQSNFYADVDFKEFYTTRQHLGEEEVDGVRCHVLSLTPADGGKPVKRWIDAATYLPVQQQFTIASPMGEVTATAKFSDYRDVSGMKMAHRTVNSFAGIEQVMTFDKVEANVAVDAATFAPPPAVQKLLEKQ